jgi:hypothetical protein
MANPREKESPLRNFDHYETRIEPIQPEHIRPSITNQHHQANLPPLRDKTHHVQPNPYETNDNPYGASQS